MTDEQDYISHMEVMEAENREFLKTIPLKDILEYLVTFEDWEQYLPLNPMLHPGFVAEKVVASKIQDVAYFLAFEHHTKAKELSMQLKYYLERIAYANIT